MAFEHREMSVRPNRSRHRRHQAHLRELRLRLVVVDVVSAHDIELRCISGLPGPENDPNASIMQRFADGLDEAEAGVVGLHHDIEENDCHVRGAGEHGLRLTCGVRVEEGHLLPPDPLATKRYASGGVDLCVVVDDEDLPGRQALRCRLWLVEELENVVVGLAFHFETSG